jgi:hypothetical protein
LISPQPIREVVFLSWTGKSSILLCSLTWKGYTK